MKKSKLQFICYFLAHRRKKAWGDFKSFLVNCTKTDCKTFEFSEKTVILNNVHPKYGHLVNLMVLIIKQALYAAKCLKEHFNFKRIVKKFELIFQVERYYAYIDGKQKYHNNKWELFYK